MHCTCTTTKTYGAYAYVQSEKCLGAAGATSDRTVFPKAASTILGRIPYMHPKAFQLTFWPGK